MKFSIFLLMFLPVDCHIFKREATVTVTTKSRFVPPLEYSTYNQNTTYFRR